MPRTAGAAASVPSRNRLLGWKAAVGIVVSVAALYFTFRRMELAGVMVELRAADPLLLGASAAVVTFVFLVRAWRWRAILAPVRDTSFRSRFAATTIGFMGNNLLPARMGEFMRAYALSRMEPVPLVSSFASLVIERVFDGILVIALLFAAMSLPGFPAFSGAQTISLPGFEQSFTIGGLARAAAVFIGAVIIVLVALVIFPRPAVRALERLVIMLPTPVRRPLVDALEAFLSGVGVLRAPVPLLHTSLWSILLWLINGAGCWIAFRAFGYDLPFAAALFFQSAIALAVSVPSAPGFVGVYHGMAAFVLAGLWDQSLNSAGAFAVGFHLVGFVPVTLIGLYYAWRMGLSLRDVRVSEEVVEEAVEQTVAGAAELAHEGEMPGDA
jgi:glycosyltransferase 2 family protein